jgi:hypothetical protein
MVAPSSGPSWPQLIGFARAKEFLMTGEMLTASASLDTNAASYYTQNWPLISKSLEGDTLWPSIVKT